MVTIDSAGAMVSVKIFVLAATAAAACWGAGLWTAACTRSEMASSIAEASTSAGAVSE
jgi:hypothetical protein